MLAAARHQLEDGQEECQNGEYKVDDGLCRFNGVKGQQASVHLNRPVPGLVMIVTADVILGQAIGTIRLPPGS